MGHVPRGPTFLILGAQKSGTTWFARMLGRQPDVFIPEQKELHFFTTYYGKGKRWYHSFFACAQNTPYPIVGEATPNYLAVTYPGYGDVAHRIARYRPDMRFVVLLRNPIDRALSAYAHHVVRGRFNPMMSPDKHFEALLDGYDVAGILEFGRYGAQLEEYFRFFDSRQFLIFLYEDLVGDRAVQRALSQTLRFLDASTVEPIGPFNETFNASPRTRAGARLGAAISVWMCTDSTRMRLGGITSAVSRKADILRGRRLELSSEVRCRLAEMYRGDVNLLSMLLERPVSVWRDFRETSTLAEVERY